MSRRVGIVQLAQALGLSTYAVSRALNGHRDVSDETRRRVEEMAVTLGYVPDARGRTLRTKRSDMVGFILTPSRTQFVDPYFLPVLTGAEAVLRQAGLDMIVASDPVGDGEMELFRKLTDGGRVDAIIISRIRIGDPRPAWLRERGVPFAMLGRDQDEPASPFIDADHFASGREATNWLLARGHRRIALINTPRPIHGSGQRLNGYREALDAAGLPPDPDLLAEGDYTAEAGSAVMAGLLALRDPPTAVLCGNDEMAFGAAKSVSEAGLAVGRDVSLIGCDDIPLAAQMSPPLTTLRTSGREVGERLGALVLSQLRGETPESWLFTPELVVRESAGPLV
jgi:LacI family transcriptional regulator